MTTLLEETINVLIQMGHTPNDVEWVGSLSGEYKISWDEFAAIADFEYDNDFGKQEIASDLCIVGKDWWLNRREYDGSEWWGYNAQPVPDLETKKFDKLLDSGWYGTIKQIMEEKDE